jgi:hypothetical protein
MIVGCFLGKKDCQIKVRFRENYNMRPRHEGFSKTTLTHEAVATSLKIIRVIQQCKAQGITRLILNTIGLHNMESHAVPFTSCTPIIGQSAASGICKCLAYEMPSLTSKTMDLDPYQMPAKAYIDRHRRNDEIFAENSDSHGLSLRRNIMEVPRMQYQQDSKLSRHAAIASPSKAAYVITGDAVIDDFLCRL